MKNILALFVLFSLFSACREDDRWKRDQSLVDQIHGEWTIEQVTINDSLILDPGKVSFGHCSLKNKNECSGYAEAASLVSDFAYHPVNWQDDNVLNELSITVVDDSSEDALLETGTYNIVTLEEDLLILSANWVSQNQNITKEIQLRK